ncbi:MAG: hypothetical protein CMM78_10155 [Rhodospirillaceae bacterium]|nr:hypothetical protein [Rhodospirillales bacterium]MAX48559.1 hypothetical protein [Rhodospirillaceae bacterium]
MKTNNRFPYTRQKCIQHTVIREICNKNRTTYSKKINPPMIDPPKAENGPRFALFWVKSHTHFNLIIVPLHCNAV